MATMADLEGPQRSYRSRNTQDSKPRSDFVLHSNMDRENKLEPELREHYDKCKRAVLIALAGVVAQKVGSAGDPDRSLVKLLKGTAVCADDYDPLGKINAPVWRRSSV